MHAGLGKLKHVGMMPFIALAMMVGGVAPAASAAELPSVYVHDVAVNEGSNVVIPVRLNEDLGVGEEVEVSLLPSATQSTATNVSPVTTATGSDDYSIPGGTKVTIVSDGNAANDFGQVTINTVNDTIGEGTETVSLRVSTSDADESGDINALVRILDDEAPISVSIDDEWRLENHTSQVMSFTVRISKKPVGSETVSMRLFTENASAELGDYDRISKSNPTVVTFTSASALTQEVTVGINDDSTQEPVERFKVLLTQLTGAVAGDAAAYGYILNDDGTNSPTPTSRVYIGDAFLMEGQDPDKTFTVPVRITPAPTSAVSFKVYTANGSATGADDDYDPVASADAKTITFAAGQATKSINVTTVDGDAQHENAEAFYVRMKSPLGVVTGDGSGTVRIGEEEGPVSLNVWDDEAREGVDTQLLHRVEAYPAPVAADKIAFTVRTGTLAASPANATAGADFTATELAITDLPAGDVEETLQVPIAADAEGEESAEEVLVLLTGVSGAVRSDTRAEGTILDAIVSTPVTVTAPADIASHQVNTMLNGVAAAFTEEGDQTPYVCDVDFGDGTGSFTGTVETVGDFSCTAPPHTYDTIGLYTITFSVSDSNNDSDTDTMTVNVTA